METSRLSLYPIKLIFIHARPPHPLIEVRRLCIRREHTGSEADQERILYGQLVQLVGSRKPSRNRLTKYVVKKIESIHAGHHDSNTLGEHEFFQMITAADYERGGRPVADIIQLRVIVDIETDEEALLTLLEDVDSPGTAVSAAATTTAASDHGVREDDYDEYIIDRLHMEEFAISFSERQQSGAVIAALKRLPTFLAERVRGIYRKLQYGLAQDDVEDQQPHHHHHHHHHHQQQQEQGSDETVVEEEEKEVQEELDNVAAQQVRQQDDRDEIPAETHDGLLEQEDEDETGSAEHADSAVGDSDSFFDSFVVVGKGGKRCLDDHPAEASSSDGDQFTESQEAASLSPPPPPPVAEEEDHPYADKLKLMREMGFEDEHKNRELLAKYKGELTKVVHELMSV